MEQNRKIINNAISCYPLLLISWSFLFAKNNPLLQNSFVQKHAKTATLLHLLLLGNVIFFLICKFFVNIVFFGIGLNIIIANIVFVFLFLSMGIGIYKANKGEDFGISESVKIQNKQLVSLTKNTTDYKEEDKLTILFSYIPFIGLVKTVKYDNNTEIRANIILNIVVSSSIILIYIFGNTNIASLLILAYSIFIAFIGINIFIKNEQIHIKLPDFLIPEQNIIPLKAGFSYIGKYIRGRFESFEHIIETVKKQEQEKQTLLLTQAKESKSFQGPKWIIYTPFLNIFTLFQKNTNYKSHIYNGITITLLYSISIFAVIFKIIPIQFLLLFVIPICVGIGKLYTPVYRMPYIYSIYEMFTNMKHTIYHTKKVVQEKQAEVTEERLVVGGNAQVSKNNTQKK